MKTEKGFTKAPNKLLFHNNLSPIAKIVFVGLSYYDRGRGCFCKRSTLAQMLNVSLYQLRKAIQELIEAELIVIHRRGYGKTSIIRVVGNTETQQVPKTPTHNKGHEEEGIEEEFVSNTDVSVVENEKDTENNPPVEPQAPTAIQPNPEHLSATQRLHELLQATIRPTAYNTWFPNKTAVSYEDDTSITIRCLDSFTATWLQSHFTDTIQQITGKSIAFHAKESNNGKEDDRHRGVE
jgi:hypothetical protein